MGGDVGTSGLCLDNMRVIGLKQRTYTGKGTHVYILDTGIRSSHSEFKHSSPLFRVGCHGQPKACYVFDCEVNADYECRNDLHGHGTHVAGTAVGITYGVAPDAQVHAVNVLAPDGRGSASWAIAGVDAVVNKGKKPGVISMSIGAPKDVSNGFDTAVGLAIDNGFVVVTASGNSAANACNYSPAGVGRAITVGSMRLNRASLSKPEEESGFSNWGTCVDILAPGEDILSAANTDDQGLQTMTGTSMACPHVSGVAAMIFEANPDLTPDALWNTMKSSYSKTGTFARVAPGSPNRRLAVGVSDEPCSLATGQAALSALAVGLLALSLF